MYESPNKYFFPLIDGPINFPYLFDKNGIVFNVYFEINIAN
jgi:hypothetical protein